LLLAGERVVVLVRGENGSGRQRIDEVLREFELQARRTLPRPLVTEGSLHEAGLGLSAQNRQTIARHCTSILHCAASVKFKCDAESNEPYLSNVTGTENLLEFSTHLRIDAFHHISTAYVCGDRRGVILENEFDQGQRFRNDYEQSKFAAERILRDSTRFQSLTVYRPSIILGDYRTGYTSTFHGFYLPLQLVYAATAAGYWPANQRGYMEAIGLRGDERKNLVPVDWVSDTIVRICRTPSQHGRTYHLTNAYPVTTDDIEMAIDRAIRESIARNAPRRQAEPLPPSAIEDFRKQMDVYAAYFADDPEFDSRHTREAVPSSICPRMDQETLVRTANYAIQNQFGWRRRRQEVFELDVASMLGRLPHATNCKGTSLKLQFEVSGSGGGTWNLALDENGTSIIGCHGSSDSAVYMNVYTLRDLLGGRVTVEEGVRAGRVVLEGAEKTVSRLPGILKALFTQLRESE
jgi:thioester reductase-like protein